MQLHYADRIDADLFTEETQRISRELETAKRQIAKASLHADQIAGALDDALALAQDSEQLYLASDGQTRRRLNQTFFTKLFVHKDGIGGAQLTDTYGALLRDELATTLQAFANDRAKFPAQAPQALSAWGSIEPYLEPVSQ